MKALILFCCLFPLMVTAQPTINIRLNPEDAMGGSFSEIFDTVEFIPLETTKASLFGTVGQLEKIDDNFIIYDYWTHAVYIFKTDGSFVNKISNINDDGRHRRLYITGFSINQITKDIHVSAYENGPTSLSDVNTSYIFQLDGEYLGKLQSPIKNMYFYPIGQDKYIVPSGSQDSVDNKGFCFLYFVNHNGEIYNRVLPYNPSDYRLNRNTSGTSNLYFQQNSQYIFYQIPYQYKIYRLDSNGLKSTYNLIFPISNSLPSGFDTNGKYDDFKKRSDFLDHHPKIISDIADIYQNNQLLSFSLLSNKYSSYFLSLRTKTFYALDHISPDSLCYFLPVLSANRILTSDGSAFYTSIPSVFMFEEKQHNKLQTFNSTLQNYFENEDRKSNPVIVRLKPKDSL